MGNLPAAFITIAILEVVILLLICYLCHLDQRVAKQEAELRDLRSLVAFLFEEDGNDGT